MPRQRSSRSTDGSSGPRARRTKPLPAKKITVDGTPSPGLSGPRPVPRPRAPGHGARTGPGRIRALDSPHGQRRRGQQHRGERRAGGRRERHGGRPARARRARAAGAGRGVPARPPATTGSTLVDEVLRQVRPDRRRRRAGAPGSTKLVRPHPRRHRGAAALHRRRRPRRHAADGRAGRGAVRARGAAAARCPTAGTSASATPTATRARPATAVLADLENGVTSVWLVVGEGGTAVADLPAVLDGVLARPGPGRAGRRRTRPGDRAAAEAFLDLAAERGDRPRRPARHPRARPGRACAPAPARARTSTRWWRWPPGSPPTHPLVRGGRRRRAAGARGAGGSDAQELGYSLAAGRGLPARAGRRRASTSPPPPRLLEFRYAATVEQFPTIAKLRAARRLWSRVLEASGVEPDRGQAQHAVAAADRCSAGATPT